MTKSRMNPPENPPYEDELLRYRTALGEARARIAELEAFITNEALRKSKGGGNGYDSTIKVEHSCCCKRQTGGGGY